MSSVPTGTAVPRLDQPGRVTQARVARSEWTKLFSLRSTRWSLLAAVVLTVAAQERFAAGQTHARHAARDRQAQPDLSRPHPLAGGAIDHVVAIEHLDHRALL